MPPHVPTIEKFATSMLAKDTNKNRKAWAKKMAKTKTDLLPWLALLEYEPKVATRFLWTMDEICELKPERIAPLIIPCFEQRARPPVSGFRSSLVNWLMLAGVPEEIEQEVLEQLMIWIQKKEVKTTAKVHALEVLLELSKNHPEIIPELLIIMDDQALKNTIAFEQKCRSIAKGLYKLMGM